MFDSKKYWQQRYTNGGNSGAGSYGVYREYKADILNSFVKQNKVDTVLELGCGDGSQLALFDFPLYVGQDISEKCVAENKQKYPQHTFITSHADIGGFDLTMSLDVVFHLIEDEVYHQYITDLFTLSDKYVIIYAPNVDKVIAPHVRYRKFTNDCPKEFKLIQHYDNPFKGEYTQADFYVFERII